MAFLSAIAVFSPIVWLQPASAASITGSSTSCVFSCNSTDDSSSNQNGSTLRDINLSSTISYNGGNASGGFTGSFGTLRAFSFSQSAPDNDQYTSGTYASSGGRGEVNDSFTVESSTLTSGAPVTLLFTLSIDGSLLHNEILPDDLFGNAYASARFLAADDYRTIGLNYNTPPRVAGLAAVQVNQVLTGILNTAVGRQGYLIYSLGAGTYLRGGPASASADFGHTSRFFIDSQTAGVVLTSSSGHNYASPTAEPVPTPALLPGLIALSAALRRQRHKVCA
jgi:hypothetical protein